MQFGLIKAMPNSREPNMFVLNGKPMEIPVHGKLPLKKDVVLKVKDKPVKRGEGFICELQHKPINWTETRPAAVYGNMSREQHVAKYLTGKVEDTVLPVKCLFDFQMAYIVANWEQQPSKEMAEHLKVDVLYVRMFCQLNGFEPPKKKKLDTFHAIPHEKKLRMKRVGYNGPQKKTA
jgi:hypothetical protein